MATLSPPAMSTLNQSVFMYATILMLASLVPKDSRMQLNHVSKRLLPPSHPKAARFQCQNRIIRHALVTAMY